MNKSESPKIWCSLDLEMNHRAGTDEVEDIIQIGAVAFDFYSGKIIDKINIYVKLPDGKKVAPFIEKLTGITDEKLETEGRSSIYLAYCELKDFLERNDCFRDPVCWGGNDAKYLLDQLVKVSGYREDTFGRYAFNRNYFDAKKFFQVYCQINNLSMKSGMAKSMRRLGLTFYGRIHSAIDDAINVVAVFHFLTHLFQKNQE